MATSTLNSEDEGERKSGNVSEYNSFVIKLQMLFQKKKKKKRERERERERESTLYTPRGRYDY